MAATPAGQDQRHDLHSRLDDDTQSTSPKVMPGKGTSCWAPRAALSVTLLRRDQPRVPSDLLEN